jgi:hypothetical protein
MKIFGGAKHSSLLRQKIIKLHRSKLYNIGPRPPLQNVKKLQNLFIKKVLPGTDFINIYSRN